jgi:hypothetical protein
MRKGDLIIGNKEEILDHIYKLINYDPKVGEHFHYLNEEIEPEIEKILNSCHKMGRIFYAEPNLINIEYSLGLRDELNANLTLLDALDTSEHWKFADVEPNQVLKYIDIEIISK